ncbi:MAG: TetR/AcrR family transcriptional regulator [Myxococcales bacterium]|nr:TetR/AcrR family transcriptional regulator [Myxococcales bacterium]
MPLSGSRRAAEQVFLERGLSGATMEEVASRAELSKGTLYLYFKSKDELYLATANRQLAEMVSRFEAALKAGGTGIEVLERLVRAQLEYAIENPDHARFSTTWLNTTYRLDADSPSFDEYRMAIAKLFLCGNEAVELGKRDGTVRVPGEPFELLVQLWGSMVGVTLIWVNAAEVVRRLPWDLDMDHLMHSYSDLILSGIRVETQE